MAEDDLARGPFDSLWWMDDDSDVRVEMEGYTWGHGVSLKVWQGGFEELLLDVPLDATDLRHLAAWALATAEAIENPPSVEAMPTHSSARMPRSGLRAWKERQTKE
jgi:hypothetical protein